MKYYDIAVIGAGFFGLRIALFFAKKGKNIIILESESGAFKRASLINQARVHNGYHYPRSYPTALSSHNHYKKFCEEYSDCINTNFKKIYAIAKKNSYVNSVQFEKFCENIDIALEKPSAKISSLFSTDLIESLYLVDEVAFDANKMQKTLLEELAKFKNVEIIFNTKVHRLSVEGELARLETKNFQYMAKKVFNATYAGINELLSKSQYETLDFKLELTEIALISPPEELKKLGITVMDGQYFSTMPYPAFDCHSLTHVRYTPHAHWYEKEKCLNTYAIADKEYKSKWKYMLYDAKRYLPSIDKSKYLGSKFTIKAIVSRNEANDGRPIVIKEHVQEPLIVTILGSKIDNIYDLENYIIRKLY